MLKRLMFSQKAAPYLFVLPFVLTFGIFWAFPLGRSVIMSGQNILPGQVENVGFANYERLFGDRLFWLAMGNSLRYTILTLVLLIPIPLFLAVLVNSKIGSPRLKAFFKSAMFIPALTSVVVAGIVFRLMFSESSTALMNQIIGVFGLEPTKWLKNDLTGLAALLIVALWRWTGVNMMYFLAGLQSIPQEYYEAADLDGASRWQQFRYVTLPQLRPTLIYVVTISVYGGMAMFLESFMLWGGNNSPQNIGLTIVGYLYRQGIEKNDLGYASAVGVVLLVVILAINLTQLSFNGMFRKEATR
ncbi:binding-protein-dependent transport systems inner membrane component [Xylanimonas cellulosilytica DSM 15894]|uniref:Binding-protein-dependent transport systems inner membrane component n=1 Tax=Xylanimonas cellulosilytica (strain DSM 15894 / JCM 12276 / CECT 5975 / KCTC 9989 / LMG 20990 / NBRC 107835 / XIL07) TaxID=446471 RepID=D1BVH7_XYLCX|nr:sugar ABC transporter permease [Xylanimonas cellulosilytica]ACZ29448.1 binding-protein-dependent transport systems inner membrane component [Xylanimonas cellulosilytica DSM 15894]